MNNFTLRRIAILYPLLLLVCGVGYAKYDSYKLDGDAVAFMDIADALRAHNLAVVVNGYWNPTYAGALFLGEIVAHPSRWTELQTFYWVNFWIFAVCLLACIYFVRSLVLVREQSVGSDTGVPALSYPALMLAALAIMFFSFQRELSLSAVRSDTLMLFFLLLAASMLLRIQSERRFYYFPLLGFFLSLAYLTKSFGFLPAAVLLLALFVYGLMQQRGPARKRTLAGTILAVSVFAALAGPYIVAISKQRGRFTTGESARLNYSFFVDQTGRWHEWRSGQLGHATANFKHHEQLIVVSPPVYSFAQHPLGTYPLWFDPAYWTDTLQPKFYLQGHLLRLARCSVLLVRFIAGHLEPFALFSVLLLAGCFVPRVRGSWLPFAPVVSWGLLMVAIYFPIDLQDRYLTPAFLLVVVPCLAMLRQPPGLDSGRIAAVLIVLLAALTLADAARDLGERRRVLNVMRLPGGAYDLQIYGAAKGLESLGVTPGKTVACFGDRACYVDHYWARLARTPIRAEIEVPTQGDPASFWVAQTNQTIVLDALRAHSIAAIVAYFAPAASIPRGWRQLGNTNYYAYPLLENTPQANHCCPPIRTQKDR